MPADHHGQATPSVTLTDQRSFLLAQTSTVLQIHDRPSAEEQLAQARQTLDQIRTFISAQLAKGRVVDMWQLRSFCLEYALRVANMAGKKIDADRDFDQIYQTACDYIIQTTPRLLKEVQAFVDDTSLTGMAIPQPDLHQPWTIRDGNFYAGDEPITLHGVTWMYGMKDSSFRLNDLGMNMQTVDVGPKAYVGENFEPISDIRNTDVGKTWRRIVREGQANGEAYELHTSPHYVPAWFKVDNHNAWFDSDDGRRLLELTYQGQAEMLGDLPAIKMADLANEWTFWSNSPQAMSAFGQWLQQRHGAIEQLNDRWGTDFRTFDQVPNPFASVTSAVSPKGVYQPMKPEGIYQRRGPYWDWCNYNSEHAAEIVQWMHTTFKKHFPEPLTQIKLVLSSQAYRSFSKHFLMGIDPEKILPITDVIGTDASYIRGGQWVSTLFAYDYLKSICPDKPIVCSETHAVPYHDATAAAELRRGLFQRFIHGERMNLMFLLTTLGESPWWTVSKTNGMSSWNIGASPAFFESVAITSADLRRLTDPVSRFTQRQPDVLIFYDNTADFGIPNSDHPPGQYADRVLRVYEKLIPLDIKVGVVTERMLANKIPKESLIIIPQAKYVSDQTIIAIKKYLIQGGRLILMGNDNFRFDPYGQARDTKLIEKIAHARRVTSIPLGAASTIKQWRDLLTANQITMPFEIVSARPVLSAELLSCQKPNGSAIVFITNTGHVAIEFTLKKHARENQQFVDQITGKPVDANKIKLQANQVMLLSER